MADAPLVLVKGAGDFASGIIHRLHRAGFRVVATELERPLAVRRRAAFSEAVHEGRWEIEDVTAVRCTPEQIYEVLDSLVEKGFAQVVQEKTKLFSAVEPALSPVISGGSPGPHPIQGLGAGFIPKNLHMEVLDGTIQVSKEEAFEYALRSAKEEGIFVGISSGAALAAVAKKIPEVQAGARILTFCYDTGERYLSIEGLFA